MRVSANWLRELTGLTEEVSIDEISVKLTMAGLEVEGIENQALGFDKVVVGHIVKKGQHPQADKLSLCEVDVGSSEPVQIICGAPNHVEGDWVIAALPGARLANGMEIQHTQIRGVDSSGMLCSEAELGISDQHEGIIILPSDPAMHAGQDAASVLDRNDTILELGITPNRPDALSHVGVARELTALLETRFHRPSFTCSERGAPIEQIAKVVIDAPEQCPRYACRVVDNVTVAPSPRWLQSRLEKCGIRAINNVVDITNLVLLEIGHPLHAFDIAKLAKDEDGRVKVRVRLAEPGETLDTLDGENRKLLTKDLVITDTSKPIALAGVMGGANSEVSTETKQVLLEAAYFAPASVRKSAKNHGLHTEASHRFERGCDPDAVLYALDRAAALMVELSPEAQILRGVVDVLPSPIPVIEVSLRLNRLLALTGLPESLVDEAKVTQCLSSIGLEISGRDGEAIRFRIPSFRPDLRREVDLIEEVVRLVGYDKVPTSLPAPSGPAPSFIPEEELKVEHVAHDVLQGQGFSEAVNFAFGPEHIFNFFVSDQASLIRLENPLGEEMAFMRPSLIPGLLGNLAHNIRHGERNVRLYEMANTFHGKNPQGHSPSPKSDSGPSGTDSWANEIPFLAGLWSGSKAPLGFDRAEQEVDYYDLKGVVASYLEGVKLDASICTVSFEAAEDSVAYLHPKSATHIYMNVGNEKIRCGIVGETHPALMEALDISEKAFVFEMDLNKIALKTTQVVKALTLPKFPSVKRDFALMMEDSVPAGALIEAIQSNEDLQDLLEDVEIFDVYRGSHLPENKKSIAVSILLRASDRTLTDAEVQNGTDLLLKSLSQTLGAEIR